MKTQKNKPQVSTATLNDCQSPQGGLSNMQHNYRWAGTYVVQPSTTCPHCGYCSHCGRDGRYSFPQITYTNPYIYSITSAESII